MTTRLTDEEVWLRAQCAGLDPELALKSFRERFPLNKELPGPTIGVRGIHPRTVELLVTLLRERGRSDAANVIAAMFKHIEENNGLSPEWVPPGRGG
jgi:hypothetical protein